MSNYVLVDKDEWEAALEALAGSIRTKGGTVAALHFPSPNGLKTAVDALSVGGVDVSGVTATAADVLSPKKFINSSGELETGTKVPAMRVISIGAQGFDFNESGAGIRMVGLQISPSITTSITLDSNSCNNAIISFWVNSQEGQTQNENLFNGTLLLKNGNVYVLAYNRKDRNGSVSDGTRIWNREGTYQINTSNPIITIDFNSSVNFKLFNGGGSIYSGVLVVAGNPYT